MQERSFAKHLGSVDYRETFYASKLFKCATCYQLIDVHYPPTWNRQTLLEQVQNQIPSCAFHPRAGGTVVLEDLARHVISADTMRYKRKV